MTNKRHTLVLNFDENLISKFNGEDIIITTNSFNLLNRAYEVVNQQNRLLNVSIFHEGAFTSIKFLENWKRIPMAIYANTLGSYRMFFHMLPIVRQMNLRIFLPATKQGIIDVQMIASLGIFSGVYLDKNKKEIDWEKLKELGLFAQFSKSQHAPVEPFHFISTRYKSEELLDFNAVYANDPTQYLHINPEGKVALTSKHLEEGIFILDNFQKINTLRENQEYNDFNNSWQRHFLEKTTCSYCPAWRICIGKFEETIDEQKSCQQFFTELLEGIEVHQEQHKRKPEKVWQL